ncbi:MAG: alpha/beta fold hydrolase [Alphaproteobacteria bacterium]|nr:alpha/beta fold hydrolase [Alphaproteobacteria bacterium]
MSWMARLGLRLDTSGGTARRRAFRTGWPAHTSPEIKFYETPMVQYRYRERAGEISDAPTIVFTADPPATLEVYDELLNVFAKRFRVIIVELPAMGFSATSPDYTFGFSQTNDDLALFLRAIAGEGAIWAFSCVAGLAAVDLAVRQPSLVSQLVLMQTADVEGFQHWKAARDPKGILARPILGQFLMKRMAPKRMPDWYRLSVGNKDKIDFFCTCAAESFSHGALWSLASAYQVYMADRPPLASPNQPILALWGRADRSHPTENEASAARFSSQVVQLAFDDLGHFSELEDPLRVFGAICRYLDSEGP